MRTSIYFLLAILFPADSYAHTFSGMVGFYDGLSHPVLGLDHFLAMFSVGIISAQIGGKAIWNVPLTFVSIMLIGGILGIYSELNEIQKLNTILILLIEIGILCSVIILGLAIAIEKKFNALITIVCVGFFGFFHGSAHGLEMPRAYNPLLFALGFITGTSILHLFGVIIGHISIQKNLSSIILRACGIFFAGIGLFKIYYLF